jgi:peptide/nickel transport system substrate-binding protein
MVLGTMNPNIGKTAARIAGLLVLAALLCAGVQAAVAEEEQTLTIAIGNMAGIGTDPSLYQKTWPDIGGFQIHHHYTHCEPLITLDSNGGIVPWLAESYEVSDDYDTITFHLRKRIKFADGKLFNASVAKFFFDRYWTYGYADLYGENGISPLPLYINYDHSEAVDEYTLKICFTEGWLEMPRDIASNSAHGSFIHPEDVDPAWDIEGTLKPEKRFNGLGPYYVDENESISGEVVVLKRRHSWRDDYDFHKPRLDKIVLKLIKNPQVAAMALEKGEIDYIHRLWNVPLDSLPALEDDSAISIETAPETRMYYIQTAYWKEPFSGEDGILLRKAICYALDRDELVEGALNGYALPATDAMLLSPLRPDSPECCHKGYDYDLDEAKALLAEAGWTDSDGDGILDKNGKSLKDLDMVITSDSRMAWQKDLVLVVQSQLKEIGIDVKIRTVESGAYSELEYTGDYDLRMRYGYGMIYTAVKEFKAFNMNSSTNGINVYSNQNETLASFIEKAQMADSIEEQEEYLCKACNILYDEAGIIPLVYEIQYAVINSKVNGFKFGPSVMGYFIDHVEECWIE